jgi:hypothetical protein
MDPVYSGCGHGSGACCTVQYARESHHSCRLAHVRFLGRIVVAMGLKLTWHERHQYWTGKLTMGRYVSDGDEDEDDLDDEGDEEYDEVDAEEEEEGENGVERKLAFTQT